MGNKSSKGKSKQPPNLKPEEIEPTDENIIICDPSPNPPPVPVDSPEVKEEKPAEEKPAEEKPADEKPVEENPVEPIIVGETKPEEVNPVVEEQSKPAEEVKPVVEEPPKPIEVAPAPDVAPEVKEESPKPEPSKVDETQDQPKLEEITDENIASGSTSPISPNPDEAAQIYVDGEVYERKRRPTRAEVELLNLFEKDGNIQELPPNYKPKEINLEEMYQQDLPKRGTSRKKSLKMKFYNTFSRKRSTKYENDLASDPEPAKAGTNTAGKKKLSRTTSSIPTSTQVPPAQNNDEDILKKKKYLTLSGRMNTLRNIIFTPPEPKDKDIEELKERMREENEQRAAEVKPKKNFSEELARYGSYITKEVGHVFMFSGNCGSAYFF